MSLKKTFLCLVVSSVISFSANAASVADLERQVRASEQARIQMQQQLQDMSTDLNMVNGRLEEANNTIQELQQNQQDLYRQIDELRSQIAGKGNVEVSSGKTEKTPTPTKKTVDTNGISDKDAYQSAVSLIMNDKNYSAAHKAFTKFINNYPNSPFLSNAYFWLGEASLKQGNNTEAKQSFLVVIKDNESNKRAEALYKLGVISLQEKKTDYAKKFFALVIRDYPSSTTAKLAQNELNKLK